MATKTVTLKKNNTELREKLHKQIEFFNTGRTRDVRFRIEQLKRLKSAIKKYESEVMCALYDDLKKSEFESYLSEIGFVYAEIDCAVSNVKKWARPVKAKTPLPLLPAKSWTIAEPYGMTFIIGTWNYPFQLVMAPLVAAIAAGNTAVIKPSSMSPQTSMIIAKIIAREFDPNYIFVAEGGAEITQNILEEKFDYIFFTGGITVGKIIMEAASKHLTPVTLELGGKSPAIINRDAPLELTAKKITWGKFINAGQTCIAPDYLLVHHDIKNSIIEKIGYYIKEFYGDDPKASPDYPRIVNIRHFNRLKELLKDTDVVLGGQLSESELYISPTIVQNVSLNHPVMKEEIFGPILPVIEFGNIDEAIAIIRSMPKPLSLYLYTKEKELERRISNDLSSGAFVINDNLVHIANMNLPFGGVGASGMGAYHGKYGFDNFSHIKPVMKGSRLIDWPIRYPPYDSKIKFKLVRMLFG